MNIRDLQYVLALMEDGHFGRAAARCGVTQPTLSMQLANLEAELGVQLFERQPRRVIPTPQGRAVARQAVVVLEEIQRLKEAARATQDLLEGPFNLGLIPTVGPYLLPRLLPILKRERPGVQLILREGLTSSLIDRVRTSELDAAIVSLPLDEKDMECEPILKEAFVVALPPNHRLTKRQYIETKDLAGETLLMLEEGHCMREQTGEICRRVRRQRADGIPAGSIECLRQMVHAGMGCALFPRLATVPPFAAAAPIEFRPLGRKPPQRTVVLVWRKTCPFAIRLRSLARLLRDQLGLLDEAETAGEPAAKTGRAELATVGT